MEKKEAQIRKQFIDRALRLRPFPMDYKTFTTFCSKTSPNSGENDWLLETDKYQNSLKERYYYHIYPLKEGKPRLRLKWLFEDKTLTIWSKPLSGNTSELKVLKPFENFRTNAEILAHLKYTLKLESCYHKAIYDFQSAENIQLAGGSLELMSFPIPSFDVLAWKSNRMEELSNLSLIHPFTPNRLNSFLRSYFQGTHREKPLSEAFREYFQKFVKESKNRVPRNWKSFFKLED